MKNRKTTTTSNVERQTSNSFTPQMVKLRKPHPCGGNEFTVIREGPLMTLRCNSCDSTVRMERIKYKKALRDK
jgi:hypothetical protein